MPGVVVTAHADLDARDAYVAICDFEGYADATDAVRSVVVSRGPDGMTSEWEVNFRNGILRWTERDELDDDALTAGFDQIEGDFQEFRGRWTVAPDNGGSIVRFEATFDLGIPSLARLLDPVAQRTLAVNIERIIRGLIPATREVHRELVDDAPAEAA